MQVLAMEANIVEENKAYKEYLSYVREGLLDETISFDDWYAAVLRAEALEEIMFNEESWELVYNSEDSPMATSYSPAAGDVLITNGTQTVGIPGHTGIMINTGSALRILNCSDETTVISTITLSAWHDRYTDRSSSTWTKIYRHSSSSVANAAATWARNSYMYTSPEYGFTSSSIDDSISPTFCSRVVWQAYYYGPSTPAANLVASVWLLLPYDMDAIIHDLSLVAEVS